MLNLKKTGFLEGMEGVSVLKFVHIAIDWQLSQET